MEHDVYSSPPFPHQLWQPFAQSRSPVRCGTGHLIYLQGTEATCFYYLKSGNVKSFMVSEGGTERILRIYQTGAIFGEAAFFDEMPRISSAVALTSCEVVPIDKSLVATEFSKEPALAMGMIQYLSRAVRLLSSQVDSMAFRPAPQRLAEYLLEHCDQNNALFCTQEDIAAAISVSRITVNRILSDFVSQGIIKTSYGQIMILNPYKLAMLYK